MTEDTKTESQPVPVHLERVLGAREPMAMTPVPVKATDVIMAVESAAPENEDRGRQPVPTTPVPATKTPAPGTAGKK